MLECVVVCRPSWQLPQLFPWQQSLTWLKLLTVLQLSQISPRLSLSVSACSRFGTLGQLSTVLITPIVEGRNSRERLTQPLSCILWNNVLRYISNVLLSPSPPSLFSPSSFPLLLLLALSSPSPSLSPSH